MKFHFLFILLTVSFLACKNEPAGETTPVTENSTEPAKSNATESTTLGKMVNIEGSSLVLDNTQTVEIDAEDAVTLFLVRHAETMEGKTSLAGPGQARAGRIANLFLSKNLSQAYADGNASMQTALSAVKGSEQDVPFGIIKMDGTDQQAKNLVSNFKGKRVFMAMTAENVEILLQQLSGKSFDIPNEEYDNLFVVTARGLGDADVAHLKY